MRCADAEALFNAYLDGELSPALATELGAHRLRCASCRRKLALLEVTGQIIASDREPARLRADFENRLLECVSKRRAVRSFWRARTFRIGAPIAAAAVLALAATAVLTGRHQGRVAGVVEEASPEALDLDPGLFDEFAPPTEAAQADTGEVAPRPLENWLERTQEDISTVQGVLDLTIYQTIDILEEARRNRPAASAVVEDVASSPANSPVTVPLPQEPKNP